MDEAISLTRPGRSGPTAVSTRNVLSFESAGTSQPHQTFLARSEQAKEAQKFSRSLGSATAPDAPRLLAIPLGHAPLVASRRSLVALLQVMNDLRIVLAVELVLTVGGLNQLEAAQLAVFGVARIE